MFTEAVATKPIVIVEDDPDCREIIELAVSLEGYSVSTSKDHGDALDLLAHTTPAIVLVDYYGVSSDVKAFVGQIRALHPTVPIVLMTGARNPEEKTRELGLKEYLIKPFQIDELKTLLVRHHIRPRHSHRSKRLQFSLF
jgi:DNA-binding response OmpR family regulator